MSKYPVSYSMAILLYPRLLKFLIMHVSQILYRLLIKSSIFHSPNTKQLDPSSAWEIQAFLHEGHQQRHKQLDYGAGAPSELHLPGSLPLGWSRDNRPHAHWWSSGTHQALVSQLTVKWELKQTETFTTMRTSPNKLGLFSGQNNCLMHMCY